MSRNPSEKNPNSRSRQSSEKTRQAQSPASESAARPTPSSAPSAPTSTMPRPTAAPTMTPSAAPASRQSGCLATALVAASSRKAGPTHDQVAERARAIWTKSGCQAGRDVENWIEAERQLRQEMSRQ